ncbi:MULTISPECIES: glycosyltransferase family 4 protein [Cyanophyceae]|uniref:Glycosyltransferase family 4 protein n=1 Tax=Leptolyngbya subtilissima DQ-A4 TaxID=2933933 RepID=A0ABV0K5R0_9CYAN|nr:glycosyltransferase family 1 protein [Nodosilinea sp. FACHB-141]MBD2114430.1 glycosyltransferase family 4 protein [Nodosilinea sp. FACHB-141]
MRILYDGQIYASQMAGGINRYFSNLINNLPKSVHPVLTTCQTLSVNYPSHPNLKTFHYQRFGFRPGRVSYWLEPYYFKTVNYLNTFDVIHPTYYNLLSRQDISQCRHPVVLSVWDMIHEIFPEQMDADGNHREIKRKAILAAQKILCISENTKKDLLNRYSISEKDVTVTYLASELDISMSYSSDSVPECPYFLYVGSRASYKNFERLLIAFAKVTSSCDDLALCVVGSPFTEDEKKLIHDLEVEDYIEHCGYVANDHLAKLYRCSLAFVYPSLYEGFGIPPLEAMACGTVAIVANSSSLPEVVGDAGLLFDPQSTDELIDQLKVVLDHSTERDRLISKGQIRAKQFSWDKTVAQTVEVYRTVVA